MKISTVIVAVVLGAALVLPANAAAQKKQGTPRTSGQTVAVDQLPAAITQSFHKTFPTGSIVSASKLTLGREVRYELSVKSNPSASPSLIMSTEDGSLRTLAGKTISSPDDLVAATHAKKAGKGKGAAKNNRETVAVSDLPDAVKKAIQKEYPKGTIDKAF